MYPITDIQLKNMKVFICIHFRLNMYLFQYVQIFELCVYNEDLRHRLSFKR